ncbi:MAG TPA: hypothetical protein VGB18_06950 [Candidatus Thermoplasmatota archaeon]
MNTNHVVPSTLVIATLAVFLGGSAAAMESPKFDSGVLEKGESFTWHADAVGVWDYYCAFHGGMAGKINVTSGDGMGEVVEIRIENNMLDPADVTVPLGADIKWTNYDMRNHTVTQGKDAMMSDDEMMDDGMMDKTQDNMMDGDDGADASGAGLVIAIAAATLGVFVIRRWR